MSGAWLSLPVILTAIFMAILDVFVVNVAAPSLQHDLGATSEQIQWIVAGYVLAYAVTLVTGGRIGDIHGRRRAFRTGIALFTAASALCGAAPTAGTLFFAALPGDFAAAFQLASAWTLAGAGISALLALVLAAGPATRMRAATSAAR